MEKNLISSIENLHKQENISSCVLADKNGLSLFESGDEVSENTAGLVSALSNMAASLNPTDPPPIISLQGDQGMVIIKKLEELGTLAVFKTNVNH